MYIVGLIKALKESYTVEFKLHKVRSDWAKLIRIFFVFSSHKVVPNNVTRPTSHSHFKISKNQLIVECVNSINRFERARASLVNFWHERRGLYLPIYKMGWQERESYFSYLFIPWILLLEWWPPPVTFLASEAGNLFSKSSKWQFHQPLNRSQRWTWVSWKRMTSLKSFQLIVSQVTESINYKTLKSLKGIWQLINYYFNPWSAPVLAYIGNAEEDEDVKVWDDNWDDDNIEDDFSQQLK